MNSKLFIFLTLILTSCGVKSPPVKYPSEAIDSYIKEYTGEEDKNEIPLDQ